MRLIGLACFSRSTSRSCQHGLGELRNAGIRLAIEADCRPVGPQKRFTGRLTPQQFKVLKASWQKSVGQPPSHCEWC